MGLSQKELGEVALRYGFVPARLTAMGNAQPVVAPLAAHDPQGRPVQIAVVQLSTDPADVYATFVTTMFLHGGWGHLLMNMWMLWVFGNNIEDRVGHIMFVGYYLMGGIVATLCHWAVEPNSTMAVIGASGAVAAVLGGYAITYPSAKVRTLIFFGLIAIIDLPALAVLGIWFVMQLVSGLVLLAGHGARAGGLLGPHRRLCGRPDAHAAALARRLAARRRLAQGSDRHVPLR